MRTIEVLITPPDPAPPFNPKLGDLKATVADDGSVTVTASAEHFALLAGRKQFGGEAGLRHLQAGLRECIADAWYTAGCPKA